MTAIALPSPVSAEQLASLASQVPTPSPATPAGPSDTGNAGTSAQRYSMEGHSHPSKGRKQRRSVVADAQGLVSWTYPAAFEQGDAPPVCLAIAEVPVGVTDLVNVQVYGVPTVTGCVFQVTRVQRGVIALVANALSINPVAWSGVLHMRAEAG